VARPKRDVESLLGANWLARAGVLVLALGVVFFLKLAYDRGWVPIPGRFAIGIMGGLALFSLGDVLPAKRFQASFRQILSAGGAMIAYVTIYVAYALPDYRAALHLNLALDVALLAAVSALLGAYALWRNLPMLAGVAVGLSALLVAPAGELSTAGVIFVAALTCAMLAAAAWRRWENIVLTGIVAGNAAILVGAAAAALGAVDIPWQVSFACAWGVNLAAMAVAHRSPHKSPSAQGAAAFAPLALFVATGCSFYTAAFDKPWAWAALAVGVAGLAGALASRRLAGPLGVVGAGLLLLWPALHFPHLLWMTFTYAAMAGAALAASYALGGRGRWVRGGVLVALAAGDVSLMALADSERAVDLHPLQTGLLAAALVGLGAAVWLSGRTRKDEVAPPLAGLVLAGGFAVVWPFLQFHGMGSGVLLAILGLAVAAAAWSWPKEQRTLHGLAAAFVVASLGSLLVEGVLGDAEVHAWGGATVTLLAAGIGVGMFLIRRDGQPQDPERIAGVAFAAAAPMVYFAFLLTGWQITVAWAFEALAAVVLGLLLRSIEIRTASFALFAAVLARVFVVDFGTLDVVSRVLAFIITGAVLLLGAFLYARQRGVADPPTASKAERP